MTLTEAKDVGAHLIHLLTQQRLLYRQLRELAQKQSSLVDGSNPEMLLRVLAGRQRIIDRLGAMDRELRSIREQWQQIAKTLPESQRQQAQQRSRRFWARLSPGTRRIPKRCRAVTNTWRRKYDLQRPASGCTRLMGKTRFPDKVNIWIR